MKNESLYFSEARQSPCQSCQGAPCCRLLQVQQLRVRSLTDLDLIGYYLNFDNISVTLSDDGVWTVFYRSHCRYLDPKNFRCKVHDQPQQPNICVNYNPYTCFYKKAHLAKTQEGGNLLWFDRTRFERLQHSLPFDEDRKLVEFPQWQELVTLFQDLPYKEEPFVKPETDPVLADWKRSVLEGNGAQISESPREFTFEEMQDPCRGCAAYCCTSLLFVHPLPGSYTDLDFFRYALGFEGVELGISDAQWTLIVRSRCRHLTPEGRCGVYGMPERPLTCRYYDAGKCTYRVGFGQPKPVGYMRLTYSDFELILDTYRFVEGGRISFGWNTEALREKLEEKWKRDEIKI